MGYEDEDDLGWELDPDWYLGTEPEPYVDPYAYVMGMDPGGTTGVAMVRIDTEDEQAKPELIYLHQIADGRVGFKEFFEGSSIDSNLTVVSEKWRERNVKGANREPQYIEGGIHMLWGQENVEWQYPDEKDVITDEYLKKNNLWTEGKPHQMDALRHALAYLRSQGHGGTLDSLNPDEGDQEPIAQPGEADKAQLEPGEGEGTEEGEGQGGGQPNFSEIQQAMQKLAEEAGEAFEQMQQAFQQAEEAIEEIGEANGDPTGSGNQHGWGDAPEDNRKRTSRQRNGAFAGFNPVDFEEGGTTLLDD